MSQFFTHVLEHARTTAAEREVAIETELVPGHAAEVIAQYAQSHGHDLIVIGHRGHFLGDYLRVNRRPGRSPRPLPGDGRPLSNPPHLASSPAGARRNIGLRTWLTARTTSRTTPATSAS
jgi:hypothetical protein